MKMSVLKHLAIGTGLCLAAAIASAATSQPDFTGLWTNGPPPAGATPTVRGAPQAPLPLLPKAKARVDAYQALIRESGASPGGSCLGTGMPGSMQGSGGYPMEIIQRPDQLTIIYEAHGELRHVYLGDRNAKQADRVPGRDGYSSGHWEGDTLVVETDNLVDQVDQRYAHSENATIVERYHLNGTDNQGRRILTAEVVMTDPDFYSEPVKITKNWAQVPNGRLLPYECAEEIWSERLSELAKKAGVKLP